jgi:hypothetical protein
MALRTHHLSSSHRSPVTYPPLTGKGWQVRGNTTINRAVAASSHCSATHPRTNIQEHVPIPLLDFASLRQTAEVPPFRVGGMKSCGVQHLPAPGRRRGKLFAVRLGFVGKCTLVNGSFGNASAIFLEHIAILNFLLDQYPRLHG